MKERETLRDPSGSALGKTDPRHPKHVKEGISFSLAAVIVGVLALAGTAVAYLTNITDPANNTFVAPSVEVAIFENDALATTHTEEVVLGADTTQIAFMVPEGRSEAAIRVSFAPELVSADSTEEQTVYTFFNGGSLSAPDENNQVVMGDITLHFSSEWASDWFFKDGFFYYKHILEPGNRTQYLLMGITYDGAATNKVELFTNVEALQPSPAEALNEWGLTLADLGEGG